MIMRATRYIEENLGSELHLDEIADAAYCSPYHFHRLFKRIVGATPGDYIRSRRLTEAAKELRGSRRRIIDVAMEYGFESQAAFTAAFRKYHRAPPGAYRRGDVVNRSRGRLTRHILRSYRAN
jgi:AraC family transcriptional regulator